MRIKGVLIVVLLSTPGFGQSWRSSFPLTPKPRSRPFISTNANQLFAVDEHGAAYIWGRANFTIDDRAVDSARLGLGAQFVTGTGRLQVALSPVPMKGLPAPVTAIEGNGQFFFLAALDNGTVWALGKDLDGRLGLGLEPQTEAWQKRGILRADVPTQLPGITDAIDIRLGAHHALALLRDGRVLQWGQVPTGPHGEQSVEFAPTFVPGINDAVAIGAGLDYSMALRADGTVLAWGLNVQGQLGDGTYQNHREPMPVTGLANVTIIAAGDETAYALLADGEVMGWGFNGKGALAQPRPDFPGDAGLVKTNVPTRISHLPKIRSITAGSHVLAEAADGSVWAWGEDDCGELGMGSDGATNSAKSSGPFRVLNLLNPISLLASNHQNSLALLKDGTVDAWGTLIYAPAPQYRFTPFVSTPTVIAKLPKK